MFVFFLSSPHYLEPSKIGFTKFGWIKLKLWILQALFTFKWIMFKRFYEKPVYIEDPRLFLNKLFNLCPCVTIHLSNPPHFFSFLPEIPPPF
jgi:hypothetical protein